MTRRRACIKEYQKIAADPRANLMGGLLVDLATILSAALGVAAIYWMLSTACSFVVEAFASLRNWRGRDWTRTAREILFGAIAGRHPFAESVIKHPLIESLKKPSFPGLRNTAPSYVPSELFGRALMDRLVTAYAETPAAARDLLNDPALQLTEAQAKALRQKLDQLEEEFKQKWFLHAAEAAVGRAPSLLQNIEYVRALFRRMAANNLAWRSNQKKPFTGLRGLKGASEDEFTKEFVKLLEGAEIKGYGDPTRYLDPPQGGKAEKGAALKRLEASIANGRQKATEEFRTGLRQHIDAPQSGLPFTSAHFFKQLHDKRERLTFTALQAAIVKAELPAHLSRALRPIVDNAGRDIDEARAAIERWYDAAMARASGYYKRKAMLFLGIAGFVAASLWNVNAFTIVDTLWNDDDARAQWDAIALEIHRDKDAAERWVRLNTLDAFAGMDAERLYAPVEANSNRGELGGQLKRLRADAIARRLALLSNPKFAATFAGLHAKSDLDDFSHAAAILTSLCEGCGLKFREKLKSDLQRNPQGQSEENKQALLEVLWTDPSITLDPLLSVRLLRVAESANEAIEAVKKPKLPLDFGKPQDANCEDHEHQEDDGKNARKVNEAVDNPEQPFNFKKLNYANCEVFKHLEDYYGLFDRKVEGGIQKLKVAFIMDESHPLHTQLQQLFQPKEVAPVPAGEGAHKDANVNPESADRTTQKDSPTGWDQFWSKFLWFLPNLAGWALSGLLTSFGATFFYELIGKIVNTRAVGDKPPTMGPASTGSVSQ